MKFIVRDLLLTLITGVALGGGSVYLLSGKILPVTIRPEQKPVILIGTILFSFIFRLMMGLKEEQKD